MVRAYSVHAFLSYLYAIKYFSHNKYRLQLATLKPQDRKPNDRNRNRCTAASFPLARVKVQFAFEKIQMASMEQRATRARQKE